MFGLSWEYRFGCWVVEGTFTRRGWGRVWCFGGSVHVLDSLGFTSCDGCGLVGVEVRWWPWVCCVCLTEFFYDLFDVAVEFSR